MICQCAACLKLMGEKEPLEDRRITHSICDACMEEMEKKLGRKNKGDFKYDDT